MQKMISYKNMYFPQGKSLFLRFRALRKTANLANKWCNNIFKNNENSICFSPSFLTKITQKFTKNKVSKCIPQKTPKISFFYHFAFPKPSQTPSEIEIKSIKTQSKKKKAKKWGKMCAKSAQDPPRACDKTTYARHTPCPFETFLPHHRKRR